MHRSRLSLVVIAAGWALAACGGGGSSSTPELKANSVNEALTKMEAANVTPALDHSASVAGTDANANGVRDDVDRYIDSKPDAANQKASLRMMSKALGTAMVATPSDSNQRRQATNDLNNAVACIWSRYPADVADRMVQDMRKVTVNTRERYDAYMAYNAAMEGSVVKLPKEVSCD